MADLPRWINSSKLDSQAMLSAFHHWINVRGDAPLPGGGVVSMPDPRRLEALRVEDTRVVPLRIKEHLDGLEDRGLPQPPFLVMAELVAKIQREYQAELLAHNERVAAMPWSWERARREPHLLTEVIHRSAEFGWDDDPSQRRCFAYMWSATRHASTPLAQGCARCAQGRGGYQFRWYHRSWYPIYAAFCRPASWRLGDPEEPEAI